jgi:hypothetical protein
MNRLLVAFAFLMALLTLPGCSTSNSNGLFAHNSLFTREDSPTQTKETNIRGDMSPIGITQYVRQ